MNDEAREQLRREDCRHQVRSYLYDRGQRIAQSAAVIARTMRRHFDFSETEVADACAFWTGNGQFEELRDTAGATRHYRITTTGIKAHEEALV